jgi:hypothetical protein
MGAAEAGRATQEWFVASGGILKSVDVGEAGEMEAASQHQEVDLLIEKCLREMPQSLREMPPTPRCQVPFDAAADQVASASAEGGDSRLSMLNMPALPNQQQRAAVGLLEPQANGSPKQRTKKLARSDFGKIRGVDVANAPQELRCAIDGKILGNPLRSPYGHLFERETLEHWISMCGSVCPLTGQPLRLEDCPEDREVERQVLEWAKSAKAEHKRRVHEKRQLRAQTCQQDSGEGMLQ